MNPPTSSPPPQQEQRQEPIKEDIPEEIKEYAQKVMAAIPRCSAEKNSGPHNDPNRSLFAHEANESKEQHHERYAEAKG
jgi:hypothetical protein